MTSEELNNFIISETEQLETYNFLKKYDYLQVLEGVNNKEDASHVLVHFNPDIIIFEKLSHKNLNYYFNSRKLKLHYVRYLPSISDEMREIFDLHHAAYKY